MINERGSYLRYEELRKRDKEDTKDKKLNDLKENLYKKLNLGGRK